MRKIALILFSIFTICNCAWAQHDSTNRKQPKLVVHKRPIGRQTTEQLPELRSEWQAGVLLQSNGWGVEVQRLVRLEEKEGQWMQGFYLGASHEHHPKEIKVLSTISNPNQDGPKNLQYSFGKQNFFFPIKFGYLYRKDISGWLNNNHIQLNVQGGIGGVAGLLKPYYLQILVSNGRGGFDLKDLKSSDAEAINFLDNRFIVGYSGFFINNTIGEAVFGGHARAAIQFAYLYSRQGAVRVEIGTELAAYNREVPLMVGTKNQQVIPMGYLAFKKSWSN